MSTVKTAISLDKELFDAADALAEAMHVSRSKLVATALEEYVRRHQNLALLDHINAAYADGDDDEDRIRVRGMRRHHGAIIARDDS